MFKKTISLIFIVFSLLTLTACTSNPAIDSESESIIDELNKRASVSEFEPESKQSPEVKAPDELQIAEFAALKTNKGYIKMKLFSDRAPKTVSNFIKLAQENFYDGVKFHRVIPDFMIQTGDPNSRDDDWSNDGTGGPGYTFADEVHPDDNLIYGTVAMANSGPNTNGSQFFIVTKEDGADWLNGRHTIFGEVVEGMDTALEIQGVERNEKDHPIKDIIITSITLK